MTRFFVIMAIGVNYMKSWIKTVVILLFSILAATALLLGASAISFRVQAESTMRDTNQNVSERWASLTSSRLDAIHSQTYDLFVTIYNNTEIRKGSPMMSYLVNRKIVDAMNGKLIADSDISVIFVYDIESDWFLYSSTSSMKNNHTVVLKNYIRGYCTENNVSVSNRNWSVMECDGKNYFYQGLLSGKYVVGALSDCSLYAIKDETGMVGNDASCYAYYDGQYFLCSGPLEIPEMMSREEQPQSGVLEKKTISVSHSNRVNLDLITVVDVSRNFGKYGFPVVFIIADSALCVMLVIALIVYMNKKIRIPMTELIKANNEVSQGHLDYRLDEQTAGSSEFVDLYRSYNDMAARLVN